MSTRSTPPSSNGSSAPSTSRSSSACQKIASLTISLPLFAPAVPYRLEPTFAISVPLFKDCPFGLELLLPAFIAIAHSLELPFATFIPHPWPEPSSAVSLSLAHERDEAGERREQRQAAILVAAAEGSRQMLNVTARGARRDGSRQAGARARMRPDERCTGPNGHCTGSSLGSVLHRKDQITGVDKSL